MSGTFASAGERGCFGADARTSGMPEARARGVPKVRACGSGFAAWMLVLALGGCGSSSTSGEGTTGPSGSAAIAITAIGRTSLPAEGGETPCVSFGEYAGRGLPVVVKVDNFWLYPPGLCPASQCGQVALLVGTSPDDLALRTVGSSPTIDTPIADLASPEGEHLFRVELRRDVSFQPWLADDGGTVSAEATVQLVRSPADCSGAAADAGSDGEPGEAGPTQEAGAEGGEVDGAAEAGAEGGEVDGAPSEGDAEPSDGAPLD